MGCAAPGAGGVRDEATGRVLTGRREPSLLLARAALDGRPLLSLPDGTRCAGRGLLTDAALSDWLGKHFTLVEAPGAAGANAEYFVDATDDTSAAIEWTMPAGRFVNAMPLLILTTVSIRAAAASYPGRRVGRPSVPPQPRGRRRRRRLGRGRLGRHHGPSWRRRARAPRTL
jgi:uncharacterized protein